MAISSRSKRVNFLSSSQLSDRGFYTRLKSRKAQKIRQYDAAGSIGVSENFLGKIERGGESVQWGKLFQVLEGLGVRVIVDVPEIVSDYLRDPANIEEKP